MEKLIELLNEYEIEKEKSEGVNVDAYVEFKWDYNHNRLVRYDETDHWEGDNLYGDTAVAYLISKSFGFIKWLVDNDKISNDGIKPRTDLVKEITIVDYKTGDAIGWKNKYTEVEQLIMYLSIQDEPIRFLCGIIK